jgi:hypothetical protein
MRCAYGCSLRLAGGLRIGVSRLAGTLRSLSPGSVQKMPDKRLTNEELDRWYRAGVLAPAWAVKDLVREVRFLRDVIRRAYEDGYSADTKDQILEEATE